MGEYTQRDLTLEAQEVQREFLVEGATPIRLMKNYYGSGKSKHVKYAIRLAIDRAPNLLGYIRVDTKGRLMLAICTEKGALHPIEMQSVRAAVMAALMHHGS